MLRKYFYVSVAVLLALTIFLSTRSPWYLLLLLFVIPYAAIGIYDSIQTANNVDRNFPFVGHIKKFFIKNRELLQDWIFENEREIRPFDRIEREIVYHRADNAQQTVALGTRYDYYGSGYEWMLHSINPSKEITTDLRTTVGGPDCTQPYSASILNVGGMSYGSISKNATMALNGGAKLGNFASNTGEGGLTDYHLHYGGDLIFQFGTGYFGCCTPDGKFDEAIFTRKATVPSVKMIEVKISQGAKPGYGAILPGQKVTEEIARIREIKPWVTIISPPAHTEFSTPVELMQFIKRLRTASGGKPVGIKFCLGKPHEMVSLCKAMIKTGIMPDFITIDGAEGGTGAAHYESANWVGMPLEDAVPFVHDILKGFGLKKHIKLFVSGKITTGFHIVRYLALGADACYSARGMMFALGCVQALQCDLNTCPTGITTTNPALLKGLVSEDKKHRIHNYHRFTILAVKDMIIAAGLQGPGDFTRSLICRRTGANEVKTLEDIYPSIKEGILLEENYTGPYKNYMGMATAETFGEMKMA